MECVVGIPLRKGLTAIVDDDDDWLLKWKWHASKGVNNSGYYARRIEVDGEKRTLIMMHRLIMNAPAGKVVDHLNHNTLDNRKKNLRIVTQHENLCNRADGKYIGVRYSKPTGKYVTYFNGKHIGYYETEIEAAAAWDAVAKKFGMLHRNIPEISNEVVERKYRSPYKGIHIRHGLYVASLQHRNHRHKIGSFKTEEAAIAAYNHRCAMIGLEKRCEKHTTIFEKE